MVRDVNSQQTDQGPFLVYLAVGVLLRRPEACPTLTCGSVCHVYRAAWCSQHKTHGHTSPCCQLHGSDHQLTPWVLVISPQVALSTSALNAYVAMLLSYATTWQHVYPHADLLTCIRSTDTATPAGCGLATQAPRQQQACSDSSVALQSIRTAGHPP